MATRICSTRAWNRARGKFKKKWRKNNDGLLQNLIRVWLVILDDRQRQQKKTDQQVEMVTLMPRFPLSANSCAIEVSKTKQSEFMMAEETPSWMDRGVASHVKRRRWPFSSNLKFEPTVIDGYNLVMAT